MKGKITEETLRALREKADDADIRAKQARYSNDKLCEGYYDGLATGIRTALLEINKS